MYFVGGGSCSLGFLATNSDRDRLAVTAGHCADGTGQEVVSENRNPIGHVVSWLADDISNDLFGVTLISLYDNTYTSDAYFSSFGNPGVGDYVRKYGARTDKTEGRITSISSNPDRARDSIMYSTMVSLEGDSGASWVGADDDGGAKLLGLNIGHTVRSDGGYGKAYGFPIRALISLIQRGSDVWGPGFIPVGR
ncbi:hypothetical protein I3U64_03510 [Mycobacteroides abscessus subsp. abscessus]|nr:hypothetical protein [Mycobacteroides abscessus subsp. abscessus]OTR22614.1 hypothetical protein B9M80_12545 [Mycobacteroides abscessus]MBN7555280.1 hypothetical protein [Mycobacteroides abscessus subsp. abscessus]QSM55856.1 hypothetical protein IN840_12370 [Mycobacteroides abscessus subsp. abscessus]QSN23600.1 hypothetical protein I3U41_12240 [Mycobacteroides abscessus subsp. abscessus]